MEKSLLKWWLLLCISSQCALSRGKMDRREALKYKVVVTHPRVPQSVLNVLKPTCDIVVCKSNPPSHAEILQKVQGANGLLWVTTNRINAEVLDAAGPRLKVISTMADNVNFIDVKEVKDRSIKVGYTPAVMEAATADLAFGLMIAAARRFVEGQKLISSNSWLDRVLWLWGQEIRDSYVGFYGFGGVAQAILRRLNGFGFREAMYILPGQSSVNVYASPVSFRELLETSDFIFITAPLTAETKGVFNATTFRKMKKTAVLVNVAHGEIINQNDLYDALKSNTIFAAGLDVTTPEPLPANDQLMELPNCVITPRLAYATNRTYMDMGMLAAQNLVNGLSGQPMVSPEL